MQLQTLFLIIILFFISMNLVFSQSEKDVFANISVLGPQWSNNDSNSTNYTGDPILLYTNWTDNVNLSYAVLSTNETGAWNNITDNTYGSPMALGNFSAWSNFTWQNTSLTGSKVIAWMIYANDTEGFENVTSEMNFTLNVSSFVGLNLSAALQRGILFGSLTANTNNNMAENNTNGTGAGQGNVTEYWIGNDPSSTGTINLFHNASNMDRSGVAADIILIANVTHESNSTRNGTNVNMTLITDGTVKMTNAYSQIGAGNCTSIAAGNVCWVAYWLDVPQNIPSGTYNTTYNYCGNLSSESTPCR